MIVNLSWIQISPTDVISPVSMVEDGQFLDVLSIPEHHMDHEEVFNKATATSLPPHCPYDYRVELFAGTSPQLPLCT